MSEEEVTQPVPSREEALAYKEELGVVRTREEAERIAAEQAQ
ncbi:hypothetical protein SEA_LIDONG_4 [Gordonia phage Lidong]|uniref:Uncharacterized protein n=5 Tax=Woesvirus woes TaxID=1982751 RepID=A0A482JJ97_9CAUD|nr:hypothetical protein SEA_GUILLAUME_4 [Gordonia phage Guillaume]QAX95275.1 hypothetical protein SEA_HELLO_4 [Gordonia phage Hello]QBP31782.1 hypothetical protein SEA_NIMI13_4 [Gordonia phage Nimi13]QDF16866.1 hypothetical protein SEA_TEAL_4 [Gordonia phage Teal]QDH48651.1 hypothetical protein SEA_NEWT_4 [Gordonia phage Newt]UVF60779.1 hypothetical protein SEA_STICKER17_4 [Gordonia phage Sticker17]UVK60243.1 hypothetical protein SEA_SHELLEY_4 [Gordonia phage Shelley]UVK60734.1 hypothetical 